MALNITIGSTILLFSTIPVLLAAIISARGYLQRGYREYLYMLITWLFLWMGNLLIGISYLTLELSVYRIGIAISGPLLFGIIFLVDSVSREHVDPRKVAIAAAISAALAVLSTEPDAVSYNMSALGEIGPSMVGNFGSAGAVAFLASGLFWLYYMTLIHLRAPSALKEHSRINLLGAILAGPGSMLAFASGVVWYFPGTDYLFIAIGALMTSYAFSRQPKLAYVLPFKVFRLIAFDMESGIAVFTYTWEEQNMADSSLFSGALTGVISLLRESLGKGVIEYIAFQEGVLLIDYVPEYDIGFALISSKSNETLKQALGLFSEAFIKEYKDELRLDRSRVDQFNNATELVDMAFPFVVGQ